MPGIEQVACNECHMIRMLIGSADGNAVVDAIESRKKQATIQTQRDSKWSQSSVQINFLCRRRGKETRLPPDPVDVQNN